MHDILVSIDGKRLQTAEGLEAQLQDIKERQVELTLLRRGREHRFKVTPLHGQYTITNYFFHPRSVESTASTVDAAEEIVVKLRAALADLKISLEHLERAAQSGETEEEMLLHLDQ